MASFIKSKLKRARDSLSKKDYEAARDAAADVLSYEPENYNANVFLGLALYELKQHDQSEQAYRKAINSSPEQLLAWQGIAKFYEQTQQWDKYAETLQSLMQLFRKNEDATKCAESVQKLIDLRRQQGAQMQLVDSLYLLLPGSPYYDVLYNLPAPDPTARTATTTFVAQSAIHNTLPVIQEIVQILEREEDEAFRKEVDKRRMRLGASGPEMIRKEVGRELWGKSRLPKLYEEILGHPNAPDDLRRLTESQLLEHKQRYQGSLPNDGDWASQKVQLGKEIDDIVSGIVLLNIPNEQAWMTYIEGSDCESLDEYDMDALQRFLKLFPELPMSRLINAYFTYIGIRLHDDEEEDGPSTSLADDIDPFDEVLDAFNALQDSIFAYRALSDIYSREKDHQNAIKLAESGLALLRRFESDKANDLYKTRKAFNITLAIGLVHYFPPKHHRRAIRILDEILGQDPNNVPCLMGRAHVYQAAESWSEAAMLFRKVVDKLPEDLDVGLEAREEHGWCIAQQGDFIVGIEELQSVLNVMEGLEGNESRKARVWWRLGQCYWSLGDDTREEAYRHFIASLKRCSTYAPAFTSLGIYYSEFATPPDPTRASKCFQKAFEIDIREAEAARRLAESFAEDREWDLVEVVARRTIEGEGGLEGGMGTGDRAALARYRPTNAWAWKALGIVELNQRKYSAAIDALQVALRTDQKDALTWLRLGEAYSKAGRHTAALRALIKSRELAPHDWICSYLIGEVQRQTDQLQEAIKTFEEILETRPAEVGVLVSLAESLLAQGRSERVTGYMLRAESSFITSISVALRVIEFSPEFRRVVWKIISDALLELSESISFADEGNLLEVLSMLKPITFSQTDERLTGLIEQPLLQRGSSLTGFNVLKVTLATCSYRLTLHAKDDKAITSAWFDLGVACFQLFSKTHGSEIQENAYKQALDAVRQALLIEPGNPVYWSAFGNFNAARRPKIAQHAYIRALEIDDKNAPVWTDLGLLYFQNNDVTLANEAFSRAQVLDPDYTLAWVGQGLVATENGHDMEARALFEHAVGLSADVPAADIEYAQRAFQRLSSTESSHTSADMLLPAFFSLDRYCKRRSDDPSALHLFGLVCERLGHDDLAIQMVMRSIGFLESVYEETEDAVIERQYTISNANLGRLRLATKDYPGAIEAFETSYSLLSSEVSSEEQVVLRTMCQLGTGLAHFHLGDLVAAVPCFETALEIAAGHTLLRGHATVLLSQTLWSLGTEEYMEAAKSQLLESITSDPENIAAVTALAAMGLTTDDEALLDAALSEILSLSLEERQRRDPAHETEDLLTKHYLVQGNLRRAIDLAQEAVRADPTRQVARQSFAALAIRQDRPSDAAALLSVSIDDSAPYTHALHRSLRYAALAMAAENSEGEHQTAEILRSAQKAVMLAPWDLDNWRCLAYIRNALK